MFTRLFWVGRKPVFRHSSDLLHAGKAVNVFSAGCMRLLMRAFGCV